MQRQETVRLKNAPTIMILGHGESSRRNSDEDNNGSNSQSQATTGTQNNILQRMPGLVRAKGNLKKGKIVSTISETTTTKTVVNSIDEDDDQHERSAVKKVTAEFGTQTEPVKIVASKERRKASE